MKKNDNSIKTAFLFIMALSILLRSWDLNMTPRWYSDEGTELNIAWNLINGHMRMFAITYTFVPHPPMFFIVAGIGLKILGNEIMVLRMLTASYGVLTTMLLYFIGKELSDKRIGLLASFLFAIYPAAILYSRTAFTHNQFMFLFTLTLYLFLKYLNTCRDKYFYLTCVCVAASLVSEYTAIASFISLIILSLLYNKRKIKTALIVSLGLFIPFIISMLFIYPSYFLQDISSQFERIGFYKLMAVLGIITLSPLLHPLKKQIKKVYRNILEQTRKDLNWLFKDYMEFIKTPYLLVVIILFFMILERQSPLGILAIPYTESVYMYGVFGLFLVDDRRKRNTILLFSIPLILLLAFVAPNINRNLPILPYLALGLAVMAHKVYKLFISHTNFSREISQIMVAILIIHPFLFIAYDSVSVLLGYTMVKEPIEDDLEIAEFINERVGTEDVVFAPPYLHQLIKCQTTHLHQAEAFQGKPTYDLGYISPERFVFNCSHLNAKFIILDNSTRKEGYIEQSQIEDIDPGIVGWPTYTIGEYIIYENPYKMNKI